MLSTCSRLELYALPHGEADEALLRSWFHQRPCGARGSPAPQFCERRGQAVVEHLLRLAGGLEPAQLGEPHLLEQLADALALARACGTAGPALSRLFQQAIDTGRRARAETGSAGRTSCLHQATLRFYRQRHPELAQGRVLVVGAGRMARLALQALRREGSQPVAIINRTAAHAAALAAEVSGRTFSWHQMRTALAWADVAVTATAALHPILDAEDVAAVLPLRRGRPLLLFDLGLPLNVHPSVPGTAGVSYYNLDDLWLAAQAADGEPGRAEPPAAERLIQAETAVLWAGLDLAAAR